MKDKTSAQLQGLIWQIQYQMGIYKNHSIQLILMNVDVFVYL